MSPYDTAAALDLQPLPDEVVTLLNDHHAPPRLIAHLIVVHHIANQLVSALRRTWPGLSFDPYLVQMGAALHDVGKLTYPSELVSDGDYHEQAGYDLLVKAGIDPDIAKFAVTHSGRTSETGLRLEDILVALADKCWRGKRDRTLEDMLCRRISTDLSRPSWEVFSELDTILTSITEQSAKLLAWQSLYAPE